MAADGARAGAGAGARAGSLFGVEAAQSGGNSANAAAVMSSALDAAMAAAVSSASFSASPGGAGSVNDAAESLMRAMLDESAGLLPSNVEAEATRVLAAAVASSQRGESGGSAGGSSHSPIATALAEMGSISSLSGDMFGSDSDSDSPIPGLDGDPQIEAGNAAVVAVAGGGAGSEGDAGSVADGAPLPPQEDEHDPAMPGLIDIAPDDPDLMVAGDPAVLFATQLAQLAEMGLTDQDQLLPLLVQHGGQVERVMGSLF